MIKLKGMFRGSFSGKGLFQAIFVAGFVVIVIASSNVAKVGGQIPQGVLVQFKKSFTAADASNIFSQNDLIVSGYLPQIDVWLVAGNEAANLHEKVAMLRRQPEVAWAEENGTVHIQEVIPNDNFYQAQQENLRVIGLPSAWMVTTGDDNVIAVIDTGVDLDHPDLQQKVWHNDQEIPANGLDDDLNGYIDDELGWDFVNGDNLPQDDHTHGSHVSGIAAAQTNNGTGIAGISWGANIMALKALNAAGDGTWADVAEAILYAADNGARVINMSLGDEASSETIELAVDYASNKDCLLVAATGNGGSSVLFPATLPKVIAVSATNNQDLPWSPSNQGIEVDLAAPGVNIFSTNAVGSYSVLSGTSMATPHVSGVASLVWSVRPELSASEVTDILKTTAVDVWSPGFDLLTGWGRISASQAVQFAKASVAYLPIIHSANIYNK